MLSLVLGGAGFIGSHLVQELLKRGDVVRILDRTANPYSGFFPGAKYLTGDWREPSLLLRALEGPVDCVYHLIGTVDIRKANEDLCGDLEEWVIPSVQLLQACAAGRIRRVVFASSGGAVYGIPQKLPIPEDHPTNPISAHGLSKLLLEKYLHLFRHLHGLEYQVARCANPYGEWQNPHRGQGVINRLLASVIQQDPIHIWGDGSVVRDYVYVGDVARALAVLGRCKSDAGVFNVGSGRGLSINDLLETIGSVTGVKIKVVYQEARPFDVNQNVLDISRIEQCWGWRPKVGLAQGLSRTHDWLQQVVHPRM